MELWHEGKCIARHERCFSRPKKILDLEHYLDVLSRKPGALAGSSALEQWRSPGNGRRVSSDDRPVVVETDTRVIHRSRFNFLREAQIWYSRDSTQGVLADDFENVIELSDKFYQEVGAHPISADIEAEKIFASAPAVLDLFMWLTYSLGFRADEAVGIGGIQPTAAIQGHA